MKRASVIVIAVTMGTSVLALLARGTPALAGSGLVPLIPPNQYAYVPSDCASGQAALNPHYVETGPPYDYSILAPLPYICAPGERQSDGTVIIYPLLPAEVPDPTVCRQGLSDWDFATGGYFCTSGQGPVLLPGSHGQGGGP